MKIHNKGSSKGKDWSFFGKVLLWSTALIFVSCGFNKEQEKNSNIGDFVDFINLGISVEEKEEPTFGLAGGFNLVAEGLNCQQIDYNWADSASGYNPNEEAKAIAKVKFIDKDIFKLKVMSFHCLQGGAGQLVEYDVIDPTSVENGSGAAYTFTTTEKRIYRAAGLGELEVTQTGDCITPGAGNIQDQVINDQNVPVAGCTDNSTIGFALTSFNLEADSETVAAASFQKEVSISFSNGEPIPHLELKHIEYLEDTYNPAENEGSVQIGQVWQCLIDSDAGHEDSDESKCSGQLMKNLSIVLIDDKSKNTGDAFLDDNEATEAELLAAIQYLDGVGARAESMLDLKANHLLKPNDNPATALGNSAAFPGYTSGVSTTKQGLKGHSESSDGFYGNLTKYACIYSVSEDGGNKDWTKLGAKCKKVVFTAVDPDTQGF